MSQEKIFSGHIEIDETKLYKQKVSNACARPYNYGDIWIIGLKERGSNNFIYPVENRTEEVFLLLLLKHTSIRITVVYTDSFSVYVNNKVNPAVSKLKDWDIFINLRTTTFPLSTQYFQMYTRILSNVCGER